MLIHVQAITMTLTQTADKPHRQYLTYLRYNRQKSLNYQQLLVKHRNKNYCICSQTKP